MRPVITKLFWALVLLVLISVVPAVRADWYPNDPHKMHYPQLPDPEGWDICLVDQHVADDFMCTESGKITDIHIWFSVQRDQTPNLDTLIADISIWSDAGGMPGVRLWTWSGADTVTFVAPYGTGLQGWACPNQGIIQPNDHLMYHQVNITQITDPFEQIKGEFYWLVVRILEPSEPKIGWKTSATDPPGPLWGSHAWWSKNPDLGEPWQPVETFGAAGPQLHDMAFVITGDSTTIIGACCDPPTGQCFETDQTECLAFGGNYLGDGVGCVPNPCTSQEPGACCHDGMCEELLREECEMIGGMYNGDGTSCTQPDICGPGEHGACCTPDGMCADGMSLEECELSMGGIYQGPGTDCSMPDTCGPQERGACCLPDGSCIDFISPEECDLTGGMYQGDGTDCTLPDICGLQEPGACCLPDGTCHEMSLEQCETTGGMYNGPGTDCSMPDICGPQEHGACCLPDGTCQEMPSQQCETIGGTFNGDGTTCADPGICDTVVVRPTLQVGPWLNPEDHHRWTSVEIVELSLKSVDPINIQQVEFSWSPDGTEWIHIATDDDGSDPSLTTIPQDPPADEGDGWATQFDPSQIPPMPPCTPIQLRARAYQVDSFFDAFAEITIDESPPDRVQVITEVQGDTLIVDVNPDPLYPDDIAYVIIEVEPKPEEFVKGIPTLEQRNTGRTFGGDYHCAPTATAACLKYFEGTGDTDIAGGLSGDDLTDELAKYEGTNKGGKGTFFGEWVNGIRNWIRDHGDGYTVRSFTEFDWKTARDELERCQDVLVRLQWPNGGGHALTLNSIHNTPEADGTIRIDLMDPWGADIAYGNLNPKTGQLTGFEGDSGNSGRFTHMIIICPKEDKPGGGKGGDPIPGPDPDPILIQLPDPGKYFVRVTVVDKCNHAATLISIVQKKEAEFGDAPEGALAYPSTCKVGSFPTCMNVGPAAWIRHFSTGRLFFGPLVDLESDGNGGACPMFNPNTYNMDECFMDNDAGLIIPPAYTIIGPVGTESVVPCLASETGSLGTACTTATWGTDIDIAVTNMTNQIAYVNVLVDWNKSGEWSGQSVCPPCLGGSVAVEHVLVDRPVPVGFSGKLSALMPLAVRDFMIGPNPGYVWTRFTITPNRMDANDWSGDGDFTDGESEDYLIAIDAAPALNNCDWKDGDDHKMHFPQLPDLQLTGIDVDMSFTPLADDFECSETGHITDIHFWGSFSDDCLPAGGPGSLTFQVTLYSDIPANPNRHSMPGTVVWGPRIFAPCDYSVRRMPDGPEDWYDPVTKLYIPQNHFQAYQYNICIKRDEAFRQEKGTIYWLEIKDMVQPGTERDYSFGWKTSLEQWNDDAVYRSSLGDWVDMIYPDGHPYHPRSLDLAFVITGETEPLPDLDWGDAPDPTYPTLAPAGASHVISAAIYMGNRVDADLNGQPTSAADGDDTDGDGDDEDGVTFDTPLMPGGMAQITVKASTANAFISVWIDFDADGGWTEATDYVVPSAASIAGDNVFTFAVPAGAVPGTSAYVRVRFTTFPQIGFAGPAPNGEVEDYRIPIEKPYQPKDPVPHLKWSQPPIEIDPAVGRMPTYCGWDQLSYANREPIGATTNWIMAADDFRCLGTMPITSVHWWGSYKNWLEQDIPPQAPPVYWHIAFWSNVPASAAGTPFSRPDRLLHQVILDPGEVEEVWVGMDMFPNPAMIPESCFQYYVQFKPKDYFWQDKFVDSATGDTVFWISITAVYEGFPEPEYPWGWKTRPEHWMDDAVTFRTFRNEWNVGGVLDPATITPIEDDTICGVTTSYDLAFELDTDPEYIKWEQPFTGLRHWPHYEDELSIGWETRVAPDDAVIDIQRLVADDWLCTTRQPVTAAVWWGSYIGYQYKACECLTAARPIRPDYFLLTIWTDVPANPTDPKSYSHPGRQIWEYKAFDYDEVMVGFDKHPHDIPGTNGREPVFRYSVRFPEDVWFLQKEENTVFWFSAVAVYKQGTDPTYEWGWTNHEHVFNDDAVAGFHDPANNEWFWQELFDQTGISEDMSFMLFTEPDCFPSSYSTYADWLAVGKPNCWCGIFGSPQWPYQCDGDAENTSQVIGWRVYTNDLVILANNWQKTIADPSLDPCADFDHKPQVIGWRVYTNDLVILANNWQVMGLPANCPRPE